MTDAERIDALEAILNLKHDVLLFGPVSNAPCRDGAVLTAPWGAMAWSPGDPEFKALKAHSLRQAIDLVIIQQKAQS